jgi:F-type H+-transporting ATPase subunit a
MDLTTTKAGVHIGSLFIAQSVYTVWFIMVILCVASLVATRNAALTPRRAQTIAEAIFETMRVGVAAVLPEQIDLVFPFVATLWLLLVFANLIGIVPGMRSPTADLATTAALALCVFFFVHWVGIRAVGLKAYLRHYIEPNPLMLPLEIITEFSRTVTLAVRLFGNIMSLELAALIVLGLAGLLIPIPFLMLHIVEALIQAYIFGMLALVYVAGAIQTQAHRIAKGSSP